MLIDDRIRPDHIQPGLERTMKMQTAIAFAAGVLVGMTGLSIAAATVVAKVDTNGVLAGYIVQKDGAEICRDPTVWNQFQGGEDSYIICD